MPSLRKLHRPTACIAILAMLLWALMPVAGAARADSAVDRLLMEVCTMGRVLLIAAPADSEAPLPPAVERSDCPLCCAHAGGVPLPSAVAALPAAAGVALRPPLVRSVLALRPLRWQLSVARAPPVLS